MLRIARHVRADDEPMTASQQLALIEVAAVGPLATAQPGEAHGYVARHRDTCRRRAGGDWGFVRRRPDPDDRRGRARRRDDGAWRALGRAGAATRCATCWPPAFPRTATPSSRSTRDIAQAERCAARGERARRSVARRSPRSLKHSLRRAHDREPLRLIARRDQRPGARVDRAPGSRRPAGRTSSRPPRRAGSSRAADAGSTSVNRPLESGQVAESGLITPPGPETPTSVPLYTAPGYDVAVGKTSGALESPGA